MSERIGRIVVVWHSSKIQVHAGSDKFVMHVKEFPEEMVRLNGHVCVLQKGDELTFDQDDEASASAHRPSGIHNVNFCLDTPEFPEFEDSVITAWHVHTKPGGCSYGFAKRSCTVGCNIYVRADDVLTLGVLKLGTEINHAVEVQDGNRIKAARISIYKDQPVAVNLNQEGDTQCVHKE
jgi:hypothetical protein